MKGYKQFLNKEAFNSTTNNLKVTKIKTTNYGYIVHLFTTYENSEGVEITLKEFK